MKRREVLKTSSLILGYSLAGGTVAAVMQGCKADPALDWEPVNLTTHQVRIVGAMAEMIIPKTDTPGALEAKVDRYIDAILDCLDSEAKGSFLERLDQFDVAIKKQYRKSFYKCDEGQKTEIMDELVSQSSTDRSANVFAQLKEWTVVGYCVSKLGATEHLSWDPVPGAPYQACIDYDEVGTTWAIR